MKKMWVNVTYTCRGKESSTSFQAKSVPTNTALERSIARELNVAQSEVTVKSVTSQK